MKILITGATGLIGRQLLERAIFKGMAVHYLTTSKSKTGSWKGAHGFYWDPTEDYLDKEALDGVEAIVHLAGASIASRWTSRHKQLILSSRVDTAALLFKTLSDNDHSVKHFVSASGIAYYPPSQTAIYDEKHPSVDDSFLGGVVEAWEGAAAHFAQLGIQVAVVRTGLVLSEGGGALPQMARPVKLGLGAPLGSGKQWQSWIHIEDMVAVYLHLLENELGGVFNAVAPNPVTNAGLTKALANQLGRPLWLPNVPSFVLKLVLGEMSTLLLDGQRVLPAALKDSGFDFSYNNIKEALAQIYP